MGGIFSATGHDEHAQGQTRTRTNTHKDKHAAIQTPQERVLRHFAIVKTAGIHTGQCRKHVPAFATGNYKGSAGACSCTSWSRGTQGASFAPGIRMERVSAWISNGPKALGHALTPAQRHRCARTNSSTGPTGGASFPGVASRPVMHIQTYKWQRCRSQEQKRAVGSGTSWAFMKPGKTSRTLNPPPASPNNNKNPGVIADIGERCPQVNIQCDGCRTQCDIETADSGTL